MTRYPLQPLIDAMGTPTARAAAERSRTDPPIALVEALIGAWLRWECEPTSRPAAVEKAEAIAALGLSGNRVHEQIAAMRRQGYSVPSAVMAVVNDAGQGEPGLGAAESVTVLRGKPRINPKGTAPRPFGQRGLLTTMRKAS